MNHTHKRLTGWFSVLACLFAFGWLASSFFSPAVTAQTNQDFVSNEVILKLQPGVNLAALAAQYNLNPLPMGQFGTREIYRMSIVDGASPITRAQQLAADAQGRVVYAEPNYFEQAPESVARVVWASGSSSTQYLGQWAATKIRLPEAHTVTAGGGIIVAVLDTGVDRNHPALVNRLLPGRDFVNDDFDPSEEGVYGVNPGYGHGTHVAGLVALAAPQAQIMPLRVLDPDGVGHSWVLAEALAYAANPDGNRFTADGAHVINLSLTMLRQSNLLNDVVTSLTCDADLDDDDPDYDRKCLGGSRNGIVVVAAAGNRASTVPEYPAAENISGLLSVAASTPNDMLTCFSNRGAWVKIAAPGEAVWSTVPGGGYGSWSGTSMAAPLVAGTAALLRAYDLGDSASSIAQKVHSDGHSLNNIQPDKRLDAGKALGR